MLGRKKKPDTDTPPPVEPLAGPTYQIRRLQPAEHWQAVGHMYRNYPGVDTNFEQVLQGRLKRPFLRWLGMPVYFWVANEGWGLWLADGQLAGQLYLQHRQMVTHINDIEVNRPFQGRGYSHILLNFAAEQARRHGKTFLTLAVTLTNSRAVALYRKSEFQEQHHRYFYLSRPWWGTQPGEGEPGEGQAKVRLVSLNRQEANRNLSRFFELEMQTAEPIVAPVWLALYRPDLPGRSEGFSFAVYLDDSPEPQGHADFFEWGGRGRWRLYTDPAIWGSPAERALFEAFLYQARGYSQLGLMVGTHSHHIANLAFTRDLGLIERDTERMLMIRPL